MPDDPYRTPPAHPEADDAIARLAAQGERRIAAAREKEERVPPRPDDTYLRDALGAYYGSPFHMASYVAIAFGVAAAAVPVLRNFVGLALAAALVFGGLFARLVLPPRASRARVAAERAWAASLPFQLDGYFDVVSAPPVGHCELDVEVLWAEPLPSAQLGAMQSALGVLDTQARVRSEANMTLTFRSGRIAGATGAVVNRSIVHRNTRLVIYVHDLVSKVLLPVHRSKAIARVSVARRDKTRSEA